MEHMGYIIEHNYSTAISGTDWLEAPTIYGAYVRAM